MNDDPRRRPGWRRWYRAIERERHRLNFLLDEPVAPTPASPFNQVVNGVIQELGLEETVWHRELIEAWPELVGRQVAARARPGPVDRGILTVYVNSSPWLQELSRYGQRQILQKVQDRFSNRKVRSIRLQLDPDLAEFEPRRSRFRRPR